ncbi:MAG TPA: SDR family NAD(P)-dependent oxidoreductase [Acidimicrobiales bacterium]|nr:SDR family NAD(P)-dependent oxidoreductase [Acidimicrobiales bacterium]
MNDAFGRPQSVVVLGGTSEIAGALVDLLVADRCRTLVLAGRDREALTAAAARARSGGAQRVETVVFDAADVAAAAAAVAESFAAAAEGVDLVVVALGLLSESPADASEPSRVVELITANFTWPAAAIGAAAERLRVQGGGRVVVLSSVAAVRARPANFIYGSAKAGLDRFALGLSEALRGSGVLVQVVRPGFVRTKMTRGLRPAPFAVGPEAVAAAVLRGLQRNEPVIWVPPVLRWSFVVLRLLPGPIWRRLAPK